MAESEPEHARLVDNLIPDYGPDQMQRAGCETWSCAWSPDGSYFAWSCGYKCVKLVPWDRHKHKIISGSDQRPDHPLVTIDVGELVWAVAFGSPTPCAQSRSICLNWYGSQKVDRELILAVGTESGRICIWDVITGHRMHEFISHTQVIRDLKFAPDGSLRLASASRDGTIKIWQTHKDGDCSTLEGRSKWIYACVWSPDSDLLASVGNSLYVLLWDMKDLSLLHTLKGHRHDVCDCDFSPDGALLATSSYDTRILLWDPRGGRILRELGHSLLQPIPAHIGGGGNPFVRSVSFCHDGRHVASVADDRYIRFWDIFNPKVPEQIAEINNALSCSYSPDGAVLAVGTRNGSVSFWMSPMQVLSLQHLCRMAIRRVLTSSGIEGLTLPSKMKHFLHYIDPKPENEL